MVGLVVVSHSEALAEGVVALAREMGGAALAIEAAGGIDEPGVLGTDAERVRAAIERAASPDGVLVLMDLGSALMSAEFAVELLVDPPGPVRLSQAPLVEGAVAAAVAASGGATLDQVEAEARGALLMKQAQIAGEAEASTPETVVVPEAVPDATDVLLVRNAIGLHARPAARLIDLLRGFDADVRVAKPGGGPPVRANSLTNLVALSAHLGDTLLVSADGPEASEALAALNEFAAGGFGEGVVEPVAAPRTDTIRPPASALTSSLSTSTPPEAGTVLSGVGASAGIAIGSAHRLGGPGAAAPIEREAGDPASELALLERALAAGRVAIAHDRELVAKRAGPTEAEIFDAHLALLEDDALLGPARAAIDRGANAERAWQEAVTHVAAIYRSLPEPLLAERATDVVDVGQRILTALSGSERDDVPGNAPAGVVIADELTPAGAVGLDRALVVAIATARGSSTSHAAILARGLGLPAVVGLGASVLAIPDGTPLLLNGDAGTITVAPAQEVVRDAEVRFEQRQARAAAAREHALEPALTRDGKRIEVCANLGAVKDAQRALALGAEGVGLLRTEFMFADRPELPSEDEQADALRQIAQALDGRPLVVRTLDAGADKPLPALAMPHEDNPFLGVRGLRLALARPEVLATQFRAILRVAAEHPVATMLPMVATLAEVRAARAVLEQARSDTGVRVPMELGIMVEIPAAALTAARLAEHVDFFSLGTNDLTQYTMAAERGDARLAALLEGPQPAVLRLVRATVEAAATRGRWVGVCGELAGDPAAAVLLAGLGVTELSMASGLIPEVKAALREVELAQARVAALAAIETDDAATARALALELLSTGT
jgi:phosphoenolpyruvate-protein phosphotransferase/dihydroxyacetone kinase phosphotransfer subunit